MTRDRGAALLLGLLVVVALLVRLWGITFGLPHVRVRPDELMILGKAIDIHAGQPNYKLFDYPGVYIYLVAGLYAIYYAFGLLTGRVADASGFVRNFFEQTPPYFFIPRVAGAVLGAGTVAVAYGIGATLLTRSAALLSALFLSLAFLHVRDSHYATTDVPMTFFVMCAVLMAARVYRDGRARDAWLAGIFAGLASGTKYNAVLVTLTLAAVEALRAWDARADWRRAFRDTHIARMAIATIALFVITNPYLFLDYKTALEHLQALQASTAGGMTPPELLGRGWTYHLPYSLRYGLGVPMLVAALAGMVWMAVRAPRPALILAIFPVVYYAITGAGHNVFVRYMIPVVPFLCIFAGYAVAEAARFIATVAGRTREPIVAAALGVVIVMPSAWSVVQFDRLLAREDNRNIAARWVNQHVPAGSSIYTAGNLYGHLQLEERGKPQKYRYLDFDWRGERFTQRGRPVDERPDWILLQRSGIVYSHVSPAVERLLKREYSLVHTLRAADLSEKNFYDIQDGFYAPFGSYKGVQRFGPNYEVYRRRE